jgi:hypothetical protein
MVNSLQIQMTRVLLSVSRSMSKSDSLTKYARLIERHLGYCKWYNNLIHGCMNSVGLVFQNGEARHKRSLTILVADAKGNGTGSW